MWASPLWMNFLSHTYTQECGFLIRFLQRNIEKKFVKIWENLPKILGSESQGISKSLLNLCDEIYSIPIYGTIECLNVSVATGITLYEVAKCLKKNKWIFEKKSILK